LSGNQGLFPSQEKAPNPDSELFVLFLSIKSQYQTIIEDRQRCCRKQEESFLVFVLPVNHFANFKDGLEKMGLSKVKV
jgi:hypothetical protein